MKKCKIESCENKASTGRGMCHKHYKRFQLYGDPNAVPGISGKGITQFTSLRDRFEIQHVKGVGCWEWTGRISVVGYGQIKDHYKTRNAHRVSYELNVGPIPDGLVVCHTCDNRKCVNPSHLWVGTFGDNNRDREAKGRGRWGPNSPNASQRKS
jgi:hypothetical protein